MYLVAAIPLLVFITAYTAGLANKKNRNPLGWLVLALLLPVLALILTIVLPPNPAPAVTSPAPIPRA